MSVSDFTAQLKAVREEWAAALPTNNVTVHIIFLVLTALKNTLPSYCFFPSIIPLCLVSLTCLYTLSHVLRPATSLCTLINTHTHTQPASSSYLPLLFLSAAAIFPLCLSLSVCPSFLPPPVFSFLSLLTLIPGPSVRLACLTGCEVAAGGFFSAETGPSAEQELLSLCTAAGSEQGGSERVRLHQ